MKAFLILVILIFSAKCICGNGEIESNEVCDDGNLDSDDGCDCFNIDNAFFDCKIVNN